MDAINDKNVLPFRVDYIKTMDEEEEITDEMVWDINREKVMMAPMRIRLVTQYILEHFDQKTYRGDKTYIYNTLTNIAEVASAKRDEVEEIKQKQRIELVYHFCSIERFDGEIVLSGIQKADGSRPDQEIACCNYFQLRCK